MENLIEQLTEILEVDNLDVKKKFEEYDEWDSLSSLSVIAMLDAEYGITMSNKELMSFSSIEAFCNDILSRK